MKFVFNRSYNTMMFFRFIRLLIRILSGAHLSIVVWLYGTEYGSCSNMELPRLSQPGDLDAARLFQSNGTLFHAATFLDIVCITCILLLSKRERGSHDLTGIRSWVPMLMISYGIAFRARYTEGLLSDSQSCASLACPTTSYSVTLSGCPGDTGERGDGGEFDSFYIDWNARDSWCPIPRWYDVNAAQLCNGLTNIPDVASCYRYGCTYELTQYRYVGVRMLMYGSALLGALSLLPYSKREADMVFEKKYL